MKYTNITNQEGAFNITSVSESIKVNITGIHPELVLEDNSMLVLQDTETYYNLIGDAGIMSPIDQEVDIDSLITEDTVSDTVENVSYNGFDITNITDINYNGKHIYHLQRSGINPLSI